MSELDVSIIVPTYNEEGNLIPLLESIALACENLTHEIIVVDDGSTDNSQSEIKQAMNRNSRIKLVTLRTNFGQTAALAAGVDRSTAHVIIPIDADGQNDPKDIPRLLEKLKSGCDVVSGWRKDRKDSLFSRRVPSLIANWLISFVTGVKLHDYGCSLKAYKREMITNVQLYGEMHRFLPAWVVWRGGKVAEIPVTHHPRTRGKSKYGLSRTFKVVIDLMTVKFFSGYLSKPSYLFSGTGLVLILLGLLSAVWAVYDKFGPDRYEKLRIPMLLLAIFFGLSALFLVLMGLLAELLVRLYFQSRGQKSYRLVDE